jgi:hypothetical protein
MGPVSGERDDQDDVGEYCRHVEAYLCSKNHGHLIRIAGPSFDRVCGWATRGIPVRIVMGGIDRYVERYEAKGPRRRPVLIDFCEADIFDVFDEWRRAVGVAASGTAAQTPEDDGEAGRRKGPSLAGHLQRLIARLTSLRAGGRGAPEWQAELEAVVRELDSMAAGAKALRGEARGRAVERLREIDRSLLEVLRGCCKPIEIEEIGREAADELRPFRERMSDRAYTDALAAATDRLLRERHGLPRVAFD